MKIFQSMIATASIFALFISAIPPTQARMTNRSTYGNSIRNASPRGFKRSISKAREKLKADCIHKKNANKRRACMKDYRDMIRKKATPFPNDYVEHNLKKRKKRCGHLPNIKDRRACMRKARASIPQGGQRTFSKRKRTRAVKQQREVCREMAKPEEKYRCLRSQGSNARSMTTRPLRRPRLHQKDPVKFISPNGLRRNLGRARDLIKEKCGKIRNGAEKRICIKDIQSRYQGY
jgi:hypothetical protein